MLPQAGEAAIRLRLRRLELRLTAANVADRLGIPHPKYRHFETQLSSAAQDQYLEALGEILGVTPEWISDGKGDTSLPPVFTSGASLMPKIAKEMRQALALRAMKRRNDIGVTRSQLALAIDMAPELITVAEKCIPARLTQSIQSSWEAALKVPSGWLLDSRIETPEVVNRPDMDDVAFVNSSTSVGTVAGEIRSIAIWLSRKGIYRRTMDYDKLNKTEQWWADIFAARYGIHGEEESTLECIGLKGGVTRERIRQIVSKVSERAQDLCIETPHLDRLKIEVERMAPASIEEIDFKLRGLLGEALSVRSAQRFSAEILGRKVANITCSPWRQKSLKGDMVGEHETGVPDFMRVVRSCALKMIRNTGAAQVHFVAGAVSEEIGREVNAREVRTTCSLVKGFAWLIQEDDWFWFGHEFDNRLLTVTKKVLAAATKRVDVEDLYSAMGRSQRGYYKSDDTKPYSIDAPISVLVQALSRVPWLKTIQKNDFALIDLISPKDVLSEVEYTILELIKKQNGVTSKYVIDRHIAKKLKVTSIAVAMALSRSPILMQPGFALYAVRGVDIDPRGLIAARKSAGGPDSQQNIDLVRTDAHGYHKWKFVFTDYQKVHRILDVPMALARLMKEGEYHVEGWPEPIRFVDRGANKGAYISQLVRKMMERGINVGDTALVYVNPKNRHMRVEIKSALTIRTDRDTLAHS